MGGWVADEKKADIFHLPPSWQGTAKKNAFLCRHSQRSFLFFCMARGQRGNGRYIIVCKKENVDRGVGRFYPSDMSMKKLSLLYMYYHTGKM